jgi:hypothetical protein
MTDVAQELMTPHEASRWFRRSPSWLRQQSELLRVRSAHGQPLFHVRVCRAYVMGRLCGLTGEELRRVQVAALASACGLSEDRRFKALLEAAGELAPGDGRAAVAS